MIADLERFRLSDRDNKFMIRFTKFMQRGYQMNVCIVLIFILAAVAFAHGMQFKYDVDFIVTVFFLGAGITMIFVWRKYRRLYSIIVQMQEHITKLESETPG